MYVIRLPAVTERVGIGVMNYGAQFGSGVQHYRAGGHSLLQPQQELMS